MPDIIDDKSKGAATGVGAIRSVVETANTEDENRQSGDDDTDDSNNADDSAGDADDSDEEEIPEEEDDGSDAGTNGADDQGDDSDDDVGDPNDDADKSFKPRFTQFAGKDGSKDDYLSNLEKGYQETSAEGIRLNQELKQAQSRVDAIMKVAASDADVADKLNAAIKDSGDAGSGSDEGAGGIDNPFISDMKTRWTEKSDEEIGKFIEANPEVVSDPKIAEDVKHYMNVLSTDHLKRTGKLMTGGEAMEAAYRVLGLENKLTKQNLAAGAKTTAAPTRPSGGKKKNTGTSKKPFSSAQLEMARKMGKADPQAWLEKNAV